MMSDKHSDPQGSHRAPKGGVHRFSDLPPAAEGIQVHRPHAAHPNQPFRPLPSPTGAAPYHLSLDSILPAQTISQITHAGKMAFHLVGDSGGVKSPPAQQIVAQHMSDDLTVADPAAQPAFFYHLGDVVYYYGEDANYYSQFYEPYLHYQRPIFAIPGNHDGDLFNNVGTSLAGFTENFCASTPHISPDAGDATRDAMTQPNVYWTLETPFATFIGLYTNVPEGGEMDATQIAWLHSELTNAPTNRALIVSMHHPIYSADAYHSGSAYMSGVLDQAIQQTKRTPDLVCSGHVHNYQRFTRSLNGRDVPYVVSGAGGYWHLHYMQTVNGQPIQVPYPIPGQDVTLERYCDNFHGYLLMEVSAQTLKGTYYAVPRPQDPWRNPSTVIDTFTLDLQTHKLG